MGYPSAEPILKWQIFGHLKWPLVSFWKNSSPQRRMPPAANLNLAVVGKLIRTLFRKVFQEQPGIGRISVGWKWNTLRTVNLSQQQIYVCKMKMLIFLRVVKPIDLLLGSSSPSAVGSGPLFSPTNWRIIKAAECSLVLNLQSAQQIQATSSKLFVLALQYLHHALQSFCCCRRSGGEHRSRLRLPYAASLRRRNVEDWICSCCLSPPEHLLILTPTFMLFRSLPLRLMATSL